MNLQKIAHVQHDRPDVANLGRTRIFCSLCAQSLAWRHIYDIVRATDGLNINDQAWYETLSELNMDKCQNPLSLALQNSATKKDATRSKIKLTRTLGLHQEENSRKVILSALYTPLAPMISKMIATEVKRTQNSSTRTRSRLAWSGSIVGSDRGLFSGLLMRLGVAAVEACDPSTVVVAFCP